MKIIIFIIILSVSVLAQGLSTPKVDTTSLSNRIDTKVSTTINSYTGNVTPTSINAIILMSAASLADTVNLPTAVGISGREYIIKKTDSSVNVVVVKGNGSELIDGANTYSLATQYKYVTIISNGTQWYILANN